VVGGVPAVAGPIAGMRVEGSASPSWFNWLVFLFMPLRRREVTTVGHFLAVAVDLLAWTACLNSCRRAGDSLTDAIAFKKANFSWCTMALPGGQGVLGT
jgi:hypothetical protein